MNFPKYVKINDYDMELAIREGISPMLTWYDSKRDYLPYFSLYVQRDFFGAGHHPSLSNVHIMGRFLEALPNASRIANVHVPEEVYEHLRYWAFHIFDNKMKMPADLNLDTMESLPVCDLHNLREAMYAFVGLLTLNPDDQEAMDMAKHLIKMIDRYFDYDTGKWKEKLFEEECGGRVYTVCCNEYEHFRFASTVGRYVGALVRLYKVTHLQEALDQALRLKDACFKFHLREDGAFVGERFAEHVHSTTSTLSGIAMLGDMLNDHSILDRVKVFLENGYYQIALKDIGWCTENGLRTDLIGEANDAAELMEASICLGNAGYEEYYARAEKAIRCHILPMQLLDTSFLPDDPTDDDATNRFASRLKGACGQPSPYGHEYEPDTTLNYGGMLQFNFDNLAGIVSGLCFARDYRVTYHRDVISINMLFDYNDSNLDFKTPYSNNGISKITIAKPSIVRVRMSELTDRPAITKDLKEVGIKHYFDHNWLYLYNLPVGQCVELPMHFTQEIREYTFNDHPLRFKFEGDHVIAADSKGKRLCFFPELE